MKDKIRVELSGLRDAMDPAELDKMSEKIKLNLFSTPEFMDARGVMFYVSKGSEVRTWGMIMDAIAAGKSVSVPCTDTKAGTLRPYKIGTADDLKEGAFGIKEPRTDYCAPARLDSIDMVIVPGKAFDRKGERVGYGKGYYDKFLAKVPGAKAVGLAYDFQVVDEIPSEDHDVRVSVLVTDEKVIRF